MLCGVAHATHTTLSKNPKGTRGKKAGKMEMADASSSEDEEEIISFREAKRPKIDTDDAPPQPASALPTDELAAEIAK